MTVLAVMVCGAAGTALADASRYHRYWKEAKDYAAAGFAEADKAVAAMKTDHDEYCFRLSQVMTELIRSTKLYIYAFEQIDADTGLADSERSGLEPMIEEYKAIKGIQDRYEKLQYDRCLSGPSYSDTLPSTSYSTPSDDAADDQDEEDYDDEDDDDGDDYN